MKNALYRLLSLVGIATCSVGIIGCAHTSNLTSNVNLGKGQNLGSGSDNSSGMLLTKHEYMEAPPAGRLNGGF